MKRGNNVLRTSRSGVLLLAAGMGLWGGACSAPDPGTYVQNARPGPEGILPSAAGGDAPAPGGGGGGADSGAAGVPDGGAGSGGGQGGVFEGQAAFADQTPAQSAQQAHAGKNAPQPGRALDCSGCHSTGPTPPRFLFAGTAFTDPGGTKAAKGMQIGVLDNAKSFSVTSADNEGNFWQDADGKTVAFPAKVAVRDSTGKVRPMNTPLAKASDMNCNSATCHGANGGAGPIVGPQ